MGLLVVLFLATAVANFAFSEQENVSIVTEGEVPSSTHEEIKSVLEAHELEDGFHRMFTRRVASNRWGGGAYKRREQKAILDAHNNYRRHVSPHPSDMNEMVWSSKLAKQAQTWSDGCVYEHPDKAEHPDYVGVGQNLFIKWLDEEGTNPPDPPEPVHLWYGEVSDYHYNLNSCNQGRVCGHFTQVVWAKTAKVGCGVTFCPMARSSSNSYENAWLVTCNYSPGGNTRGELPYKSGQSCSACERGFCRDGLCSKCRTGDKGCECNLECENCGTLDETKCKCSCPDGFYGPACESRCQDTDSHCGVVPGGPPGWPESWCDQEQYTFVREKCPAMCQVCKPGSGRPRC